MIGNGPLDWRPRAARQGPRRWVIAPRWWRRSGSVGALSLGGRSRNERTGIGGAGCSLEGQGEAGASIDGRMAVVEEGRVEREKESDLGPA